jgi:two-component system chemotaxis response regulator CheY
VKAIVIDDSKTIRMMLKKFLLGQGFETLYEAGDGREALQKLEEIGPVDLALVDWNMPVMDGIDFIANLRQSPTCGKVRVMMVTTESQASQVDAAMKAGANAFIVKPFNGDILREKLDQMGFAKPGA